MIRLHPNPAPLTSLHQRRPLFEVPVDVLLTPTTLSCAGFPALLLQLLRGQGPGLSPESPSRPPYAVRTQRSGPGPSPWLDFGCSRPMGPLGVPRVGESGDGDNATPPRPHTFTGVNVQGPRGDLWPSVSMAPGRTAQRAERRGPGTPRSQHPPARTPSSSPQECPGSVRCHRTTHWRYRCCSVSLSRARLCDPMSCRTLRLLCLDHLPEVAQTHDHLVLCHPLSPHP